MAKADQRWSGTAGFKAWCRVAGARSSELEAHLKASLSADAIRLRRGTEKTHACPCSRCACRRGSQRLGPSCRGCSGWPCSRRLFAVRHVHQRSDEAPSYGASLDEADAAAVPRRKLCPKQDTRRCRGQQRWQWRDGQLRRTEWKIAFGPMALISSPGMSSRRAAPQTRRCYCPTCHSA